MDDEVVKHSEHGRTPGSIESPFVSGGDQSTNEASDDHDLVQEDCPEDCRPWKAGGEHKVGQEQRRGHKPTDFKPSARVADGNGHFQASPVNVSCVKDFSIHAGDIGTISLELHIDWCPAQVTTHGEVRNASLEIHRLASSAGPQVLALLQHTVKLTAAVM